jgi:hypothetical protein
MAPSKARVYPEFLPENYTQKYSSEFTYSNYKEMFEKYGIHHIDINQWFLEKKGKTRFPLFPKHGVHWSRLEAIHIADSLNHYLSRLANLDWPQLKITKIDSSTTLQLPDFDAINLQNIFVSPSHSKMAYSNKWNVPKVVKDLDVQRHILQNDIVLIVCTESNLDRFCFGFINSALNALSKPIEATENEKQAYVQKIKNDSVWYADIKKQAVDKKIAIEQALDENALYMIKTKGPIVKLMEVEDIVEQIKNDPTWFAMIEASAAKSNKTIDEVLQENAVYAFKEASKKQEHLLPLEYWINAISKDAQWLKTVSGDAKRAGISLQEQMFKEAKYMQARSVKLPAWIKY